MWWGRSGLNRRPTDYEKSRRCRSGAIFRHFVLSWWWLSDARNGRFSNWCATHVPRALGSLRGPPTYGVPMGPAIVRTLGRLVCLVGAVWRWTFETPHRAPCPALCPALRAEFGHADAAPTVRLVSASRSVPIHQRSDGRQLCGRQAEEDAERDHSHKRGVVVGSAQESHLNRALHHARDHDREARPTASGRLLVGARSRLRLPWCVHDSSMPSPPALWARNVEGELATRSHRPDSGEACGSGRVKSGPRPSRSDA
jgi:hypothetical protein